MLWADTMWTLKETNGLSAVCSVCVCFEMLTVHGRLRPAMYMAGHIIIVVTMMVNSFFSTLAVVSPQLILLVL